MALIAYDKLNLKNNNEISTFTFNDIEVEIFNYLDIKDKYDLIMVALQKAEENGIINDLKLDVYFHLNIIYMYSNIDFTDEQKADEFGLYDELESSGFLGQFVSTMNQDEYDYLIDQVNEIKEQKNLYNRTVGASIGEVINKLPERMEESMRILENFNPETFENLRTFANNAGMNGTLLGESNKVVDINKA